VFDGSAPATAVTSVISTLSGVHSGHGKATPTALEESRLIPVSLGSQGLIRVRSDSIRSRLNRRDQASQLSIAGIDGIADDDRATSELHQALRSMQWFRFSMTRAGQS
jgi:hypothetical protein